ncbi:MAG: protoporphyrinogen oxidase [Actinomycetia bacterium]|nr:protoporphyrinogen oxidase [Actinomycetes bacterium]
MGKLSFLAGVAAGYVLGAKAGRQRYEQIASISNKVWTSEPVQHQVEKGKEAARTQLAPAVADAVGSAAKATANKLRSEKTVSSEAVPATMEARVETSEPIHEGDPLEPPTADERA